ncbi:hypothetical protein LINPERHAP2_LOCUS15571 [Linum perenne]
MSSVATGSTKGGRGKGKTTKFVSRSSMARLQFPVGPGSSRPVSTSSTSAPVPPSTSPPSSSISPPRV